MDVSLTEDRLAALVPQRHAIARERQPFEVRMYSLGFARNRFIAPHHPGWDRLITARRGGGFVRTSKLISALGPERALWAQYGDEVEIAADARLDLRIAYVRPTAARAPGALAMTSLGRELLERCVERGWVDPSRPNDARFLAVVAEELDALAPLATSFELALPSDPRARAALERGLIAGASSVPSARELARGAFCSARTLERIVRRETGFGVVAWQRRYRLLAAVSALACGADVTSAGFDAGYAGTSAFITAYRRAFGTTPGRA